MATDFSADSNWSTWKAGVMASAPLIEPLAIFVARTTKTLPDRTPLAGRMDESGLKNKLCFISIYNRIVADFDCYQNRRETRCLLLIFQVLLR